MTLNTAPDPPPRVQVQWDNDEPYLTPPSHPDIRIGTYRDTPADIAAMVRIANDPRVGKWAHNRPYPYTEAHARERINEMLPSQNRGVEYLRRRKLGIGAGPGVLTGSSSGLVEKGNEEEKGKEGAEAEWDLGVQGPAKLGSPFTVVRLNGALIGHMHVWALPEGELGCEEQTCGVGYYFDPECWGQGIATAAVGDMLRWAREGMGVRRFAARVETANVASFRLVERLGFKRVRVISVPWPEDKGGGEREVAVYEVEM